MKKILSSVFLLSCFLTFLLSCSPASARNTNQINDWYIKDFQSTITVNKDSSLSIDEKIVADCGNLSNKHGIFRVLPTVYYPESNVKVKTPVELISITDFNSVPYKYSTTNDTSNNTVTWKIGDANVTVHGVNNYEIKYLVKNTIRFGDPSFDEFYWNLNGNFWDIETDHFLGKVIFPSEINQSTVKEINLYSGTTGTKDAGLASYKWSDNNTIQVESQRTFAIDEGVTLSVTFSKNIISQPVLTFWEKYSDLISIFIFLLIPILVFLICFGLWWKYGRDIAPGRAVAPEFEIPDKRNPMEMSTFLDNGKLKTSAISASIVNLAVGGYIRIEAIPKQGLFSSADTRLIRTEKTLTSLSDAEKKLIDYLFGSLSQVKISDLRNQFYKYIPSLKDANFSKLSAENLFEKKGFSVQVTMFVIAGIWFFAMFFASSIIQSPIIYVISVISVVILSVFGYLMPKRSEAGEELLWRIKGFKMYMLTAEKYRQKFNEKENIFERFLPYAMLFGITGIWISKMKQIYGEDYFNHYMPIWYVGYVGNFNLDDFSNQLNAISTSMAQTMSSHPSSSGAGGGGFSGAGGGGGGGGGW